MKWMFETLSLMTHRSTWPLTKVFILLLHLTNAFLSINTIKGTMDAMMTSKGDVWVSFRPHKHICLFNLFLFRIHQRK